MTCTVNLLGRVDRDSARAAAAWMAAHPLRHPLLETLAAMLQRVRSKL